MKRTSLAVTVAFVAVAVVLAIGAAPADAQSGCVCHTAVPPTGGAPAAHAPYVAGTTCTTCHAGMTVPHPAVVRPTLTLEAGFDQIVSHWAVRGSLHIPWVPLAGVTVYLQGKPAGASSYTDLGSFKTVRTGFFSGVLKKDAVTAGTTFRAISEGRAFSSLVMPALNGPEPELPTPDVTFRLRGLHDGALRFGESVKATARVTPALLQGASPMFVVHERIAGKWRWLLTVKRTLDATGTCRWTWTPRHRGMFKMFATVGATAAYNMAGSNDRLFRVE
jgi:hypothetical protein